MLLKDPPVARVVDGDVEDEVERRCSWWARNPAAWRSQEKPWQAAVTKMDLGSRCCCDYDHSPSKCVRLAGEVKGNWRGHCPEMDLGSGKVQTHHSNVGCVSSRPSAHLPCCCVKTMSRKVCY